MFQRREDKDGRWARKWEKGAKSQDDDDLVLKEELEEELEEEEEEKEEY